MKTVKRSQQENLAKTFDALGHYRRIRMFSHILKYGETGISFGALGEQCNLKPATLAHHISKMQAGKIIDTHQAGNTTIFTANITALSESFNALRRP